ncbi:MAG: M10 family metallopeptidase C-terminal domain-containing protein [Hyphomonadaceae bacterium]|nr:M10 family metallopeptidase C-terminal domain-containing protein [Hyphomonadaceae bacterium]
MVASRGVGHFCGCAACMGKALADPVQQTAAIPGDTTSTATIAIGGTVVGSLDNGSDQDWYRVDLVAGQHYVFTLSGTGGTPLTDPYLELRSSTGQLLSIDDDGAPGASSILDSLMRFTAVTTGTYYINARAFDAATTGNGYTLTANTGAPQNPLDTLELGLTVSQQNITVYFATTSDTVQGQTPVQNWTAAERASAMAALQTFANVTNLTFAETSTQAGARFVLSLSTLGTNVLGQFGTSGGVGYGQFAPTASGWTTAGLAPGGLGFVTLIHEFGHGLGLAHPHEDGQDVQIMQGVVDNFGSYGTFSLNQGVFTTMTYNDGWPGGPAGSAPSNNYGSQMTPMALDIALLQQKYGVNTTFRAGADTYALQNTNTGGTGYLGIWDTGGIDTMTYSGTRDATLDLRPATLLNQVGGGGYVSFASGIFGGFTIAAGVVIENATGGSGADTITGNSAANRLTGNGGNDVLEGGAGADTLIGGLGSDNYGVDAAGDVVTESLDEGFDTVYSSIDYTLGANLEGLNLIGGAINGYGNALANAMVGNGLNNLLSGFEGDDVLTGGAGDDILQGGAGNDIMFGGLGSDSYGVDTSGDAIGENAGEGFDAVYSTGDYTLGANLEQLNLLGAAVNGFGNSLANSMFGNDLANYLGGGAGDDVITGGGGNDIIEGSTGNDIMFGGLGSDSYGVDTSGDAIGENVGEGFDAVYSTGDYTLGANLEQLNLIGTAVNGFGNSLANSMFGNDLANYLGGGDGDDVLTGGAGNDILEGNSGNDIMFGGLGSDSYGVDSSGDAIGENVGEGFDAVYSTASYTLGANLEQLNLIGAATEGYGNGLANAIFGNALANILNGGTGDDVLSGGAGNDTFLFLPGTGHDVVSDFVAGGTDDRVDLSAYAGTGITYTLTQTGADAVFNFSNGDQIVLVGVNSASLVQSGDFWG